MHSHCSGAAFVRHQPNCCFCSSAVVLSALLFQMVADLETLSRKAVEHVAALTSRKDKHTLACLA